MLMTGHLPSLHPVVVGRQLPVSTSAGCLPLLGVHAQLSAASPPRGRPRDVAELLSMPVASCVLVSCSVGCL